MIMNSQVGRAFLQTGIGEYFFFEMLSLVNVLTDPKNKRRPLLTTLLCFLEKTQSMKNQEFYLSEAAFDSSHRPEVPLTATYSCVI